MNTDKLIRISELCTHYHLRASFFDEIESYDLIEIKTIPDGKFIHRKQLRTLEKIIRLHEELEINMQGIDVIFGMISEIEKMKTKLALLRSKLDVYEN